MCGIAGIWGKTDPMVIENMVTAMHHRGPDDKGFYYDNQISIGMSRLSILDVSSNGHQPMSTPDGKITIVYNGELYNFKSERAILENAGYSFRSTSDTEVILYMYEHYGDAFLHRMRGIFALAIYDKRGGLGRERLFLARDQLGVKPLLYARIGNNFIFASEMKSLLSSGLIKPEINQNGLRLLLTFGSVYQPDTMIKGVYMLLPAHKLVIESHTGWGKCESLWMKRYWSLGLDKYPIRNLPYEKQVAVFDAALEESISCQMCSDVPLGVFLSGGIDSSIATALMARNSPNTVKTFSIGFDDDGKDIDESDSAKIFSDYIGTDHSCVHIVGSDVYNQINNIARSLDQPSVDGVNAFFVSMATSKKVTVAISGTGGDEICAGYPWFSAMVRYRKNLNTIYGIYDKIENFKDNIIYSDKCDADGFLRNFAYNYAIFEAKDVASMINIKKYRKCLDLRYLDELSHGTDIERVSGLVIRGYTNNQLLRDIRCCVHVSFIGGKSALSGY
jgi:asparagine synthase (glutamine-hydrolysing)